MAEAAHEEEPGGGMSDGLVVVVYECVSLCGEYRRRRDRVRQNGVWNVCPLADMAIGESGESMIVCNYPVRIPRCGIEKYLIGGMSRQDQNVPFWVRHREAQNAAHAVPVWFVVRIDQ